MTEEALAPSALTAEPNEEAPEPSIEPSIWAQIRSTTAFWVGLAVVVMAIIFGVLSAGAFTRDTNLLSIGLNASQIMLLAVGMTFLIGAGQLDLSVGFNVIMSSVIAAKVIVTLGGTTEQVARGEYPNLELAIVAGVIAALAAGALGGLLNGMLVTRLKINSFITTLATGGIFYGIALILTSAANVPFLPGAAARQLRCGA